MQETRELRKGSANKLYAGLIQYEWCLLLLTLES